MSSISTHPLAGSDLNRKLTGANKFKSVDNYLDFGAPRRLTRALIPART